MATLRPVRVNLASPQYGEGVAPLEFSPGVVGSAGNGPNPADAAVLEWLDDRHAVLRQAGQRPIPVLLLPAAGGARGPGNSSQLPSRTSGGSARTTVLEVVVDGWRFEFVVEDAQRAQLRKRATRGSAADAATRPVELRAIIPGRIADVVVVDGQQVTLGDPLLVIEAMKMQNELRATRAGTAARVAVQAGQTVEAGDLLVVIE